jgi:sodium/bile acid cotransporter 7
MHSKLAQHFQLFTVEACRERYAELDKHGSAPPTTVVTIDRSPTPTKQDIPSGEEEPSSETASLLQDSLDENSMVDVYSQYIDPVDSSTSYEVRIDQRPLNIVVKRFSPRNNVNLNEVAIVVDSMRPTVMQGSVLLSINGTMVATSTSVFDETVILFNQASLPLRLKFQRPPSDLNRAGSGMGVGAGMRGAGVQRAQIGSISLLYTVVKQVLSENFMTLGSYVAIICAALYPELGQRGGPMLPEFTVHYVAVSLIFLLSGLLMGHVSPIEKINADETCFFIQFFNFLLSPALVALCLRAFSIADSLSPKLRSGFIIMASAPQALNSAVAFTKMAGGNTPTTLHNAALGVMIGTFVTPAVNYNFLHTSMTLSTRGLVFSLLSRAVLPLIVGLNFAERISPATGAFMIRLIEVLTLLLIFVIWSDLLTDNMEGVVAGEFSQIYIVVVLAVFISGLSTFVNLLFCKVFNLPPQECIASVFSTTQKDLTLGLALFTTMYEGSSASIGVMSIPIIVQHQCQVFIGHILLAKLRMPSAGRASTVYAANKGHDSEV